MTLAAVILLHNRFPWERNEIARGSDARCFADAPSVSVRSLCVWDRRPCMFTRSCLCARLTCEPACSHMDLRITYICVSVHWCVRVCVCVEVSVCVFLAETLTEMDETESALQGIGVLLRQWPPASARPATVDMLPHRALVNDHFLPSDTRACTHTHSGGFFILK